VRINIFLLTKREKLSYKLIIKAWRDADQWIYLWTISWNTFTRGVCHQSKRTPQQNVYTAFQSSQWSCIKEMVMESAIRIMDSQAIESTTGKWERWVGIGLSSYCMHQFLNYFLVPLSKWLMLVNSKWQNQLPLTQFDPARSQSLLKENDNSWEEDAKKCVAVDHLQRVESVFHSGWPVQKAKHHLEPNWFEIFLGF